MLAFLLFVIVAGFALFWLVTFPIRLVLRFAFGIVFGTVGFLLRILFAPILMLVVGIAILVAFVAAILSVFVPLLPVLVIGGIAWAIYRAVSHRRAMPI
jgi:hypothetical protein